MALSPQEKKIKINKIVHRVCNSCQKKLGMGNEDPCFKCLWKKLMDEINDA